MNVIMVNGLYIHNLDLMQIISPRVQTDLSSSVSDLHIVLLNTAPQEDQADDKSSS